MKKIALFAAMFCFLTIGVSAQAKTDFSGQWRLDKAKSKLGERSRIEEMTMKVTQSATSVEVETETKREPRPEGMQGGSGGNRGGGMRGGMPGGDESVLYTFDKETVKERETERGKIQIKLNAKLETDGKLHLSSTRTLNTPNGEMTMTAKETWELSDGGKTLTVKRETQNMRGTQTTEMVFTKK